MGTGAKGKNSGPRSSPGDDPASSGPSLEKDLIRFGPALRPLTPRLFLTGDRPKRTMIFAIRSGNNSCSREGAITTWKEHIDARAVALFARGGDAGGAGPARADRDAARAAARAPSPGRGASLHPVQERAEPPPARARLGPLPCLRGRIGESAPRPGDDLDRSGLFLRGQLRRLHPPAGAADLAAVPGPRAI